MSIQTVNIYPRVRPGLLAGLLACIFGVLGIFAWGIFFVPLAAICSVTGLVRGILGKCASGIGTSILGGVLTIFGFLTSPSLWALLIASVLIHTTTPTNTRPVSATTATHASLSSHDAIRTAFKQAETAIIECRGRRLAGKLTSYVASTQCANSRIMDAFGVANYKHMDLIAWLNAKRLQVAERLDRKELTEIQAQVEQARAFSLIVETERRRDGATVPAIDSEATRTAIKEMQAAMRECRERRLSGQLSSYVASVQCSTPRIVKAFSAANYRYMDLIALMNARRLELAEKLDQNELTEIEARAEDARTFSDVIEAERRRDTGQYR